MTPSETIDRMRNILAFILVASFISGGGAMFIIAIPEANKEIVTYMVGQLSGMVTTALALYFVSKAGQETLDAKRAENTGKLADAVVAAANATPAPSDDLAKAAADHVVEGAEQAAAEVKGQ